MDQNKEVQLASAVDSVIRVLEALKSDGGVAFNEEATVELAYAKQMMESFHAS